MNRHGAALLCLLWLVPACRRDMNDQPLAKPLRRSDFFQDGMASRPILAHTVARGQVEEDEAFFTGMVGTNLVETFPMPITRQTLEKGQERFDIYCSVCHGRTGTGNGMIVQRGFPPPQTYHSERLRRAPAGHFFHVITHGYGLMYSYADRIPAADRWAIAAYIRVLQLSQHATLEDVPPENRPRLKLP